MVLQYNNEMKQSKLKYINFDSKKMLKNIHHIDLNSSLKELKMTSFQLNNKYKKILKECNQLYSLIIKPELSDSQIKTVFFVNKKQARSKFFFE
jgi:hypothetical protein